MCCRREHLSAQSFFFFFLINNKNFFLTPLGGWKPNIRVPTGLNSGEGPFLHYRLPTFLCVLTWWKGLVCPVLTVRLSLNSERSEVVPASSWPAKKVLLLLSVMLAFLSLTAGSGQYQEGLYKHDFHLWRSVLTFSFFSFANKLMFTFLYFPVFNSMQFWEQDGIFPSVLVEFWHKFFVCFEGFFCCCCHFKFTIQWHSLHSQCCVNTITISWTFFIIPNRNSVPVKQ